MVFFTPLQHRPDNFFHRVLVYTLYHKKNWIKKNIPAWRSIRSKSTPMTKNLTKLDRKMCEIYFLENPMKISENHFFFWFFDVFFSKNQNFWFFEIFIEFSRKYFSQNVRSSFVNFLVIGVDFDRIDLRAGMFFLIQFFLWYKVYTSTLWKKLSGRCCEGF